MLPRKLVDGDSISCVIKTLWGETFVIDDAKITIAEENYYVCQNECGGSHDIDKKGYQYAWGLYKYNGVDEEYHTITNIKLKDSNPYNYGDILVDGNGRERKILGVCGDICFLSVLDNFEMASDSIYHYKEIHGKGWTLKDTTETIEIEGKKYNKGEVVDRLKELKELK